MPRRISKRKRLLLKSVRMFERYVESSPEMQAMYAEDRELTELELRPVPVLTTAQEAWLTGINSEAFSLKNAVNLYANRVSPGDELARIEARDQVSDEELIARMQVAPDMGGSMLVELSDFVRNRSRK